MIVQTHHARASAIISIMCRMMSDWEVELIDDSISEFIVTFKGPKDSKDLSSDCTLYLS